MINELDRAKALADFDRRIDTIRYILNIANETPKTHIGGLLLRFHKFEDGSIKSINQQLEEFWQERETIRAALAPEMTQPLCKENTESLTHGDANVRQTSEAVAWQCGNHERSSWDTITNHKLVADAWIKKGWQVRPLYAAPVADKPEALLAALNRIKGIMCSGMVSDIVDEAIRQYETEQ